MATNGISVEINRELAEKLGEQAAEIERLEGLLRKIEGYDYWSDELEWEESMLRIKDIARAAREREVEG